MAIIERAERRNTHRTRETYSFYLDRAVIGAVDGLIASGAFANRSDAVEAACRLLLRQVAAGAVTSDDAERVA